MQPILARLPSVSIGQNAHFRCIRCPNRKSCPLYTVASIQMSPKPIVPFVSERQIRPRLLDTRATLIYRSG